MSLTYVYCVVAARAAPKLTRRAGVPGLGKERLLSAGGGLWLVVADAPEQDFGEAPIAARLRDLDWVSRAAMAHEAVVARFIGEGAVIPMKLLTLFRDDERALADARRRKKTLARIAARITGCQEWGLRVQVDRARLRAPAAAKKARSGTAFLRNKLNAKRESESALRAARQNVEALYGELTELAAAARRHAPKTPELERAALLEAAFLVPSAELPRFRKALRRAEQALAEAPLSLVVTGPWPAYNFIEARG